MIQHYQTVTQNNEKVLFLYMDYNYEFGKIGDLNKTPILDKIKEIIKTINFTGEKIVLIVGGIAIATLIFTGTTFKGNIIEEQNLDFSPPSITELITPDIEDTVEKLTITTEEINTSNTEEIEVVEQNKNPPISNNQSNNISTTPSANESTNNSTQDNINQQKVESATIVTIYRSSGAVVQVELEEYLIGVVAAEMPASFNLEALKAQSVVARTYTLKRISSGLHLTDTVSTQEYKDIDQMKNMWQGEFQKYYDKIKSAVVATKGQYITYNGNYIDAVYHSTSNGYTEDSLYVWGNDIPYLKSVESSFDKGASSYLRTETKDSNTILNILGILVDDSTPVEIISRNESGRVTSIRIGDTTYTGVSLRNVLGLRSADFDISVQNGNLVFTTRGYGHGVGMSQYGANGMANNGYSYTEIIGHYYQGVQIK